MTQLSEIDVTRPECCMCGDSGLSGELYRCRVCLFRSQHRYCSNQYPKARVYRVCNWCLITSQEDSGNSIKIKTAQNSSDISSHYDETVESDRNNGYSKRSRKNISWEPGLQLQSRGGSNGHSNGRVKKADESPEVSPVTTPRKRIIPRGPPEDKLRRMKSEEMAKHVITRRRQVFKNKGREQLMGPGEVEKAWPRRRKKMEKKRWELAEKHMYDYEIVNDAGQPKNKKKNHEAG